MKQNLQKLAFVLFLSGSLIACKNNAPKETKLIPKDALAVVSLNAYSLKEKLQADGITIDSLLSKIFEKDSSGEKDRKIIDDLRVNAGINWKEKIHFFIVKKKAADNSEITIMNVLASISDKEKLASFIKTNNYSTNKNIQESKAFSYLDSKENSMLAWDKDHLLAMFYSSSVKPYYDTVNMKFVIPEKNNSSKEMVEEATRLFTQKEDASMMSVKGFGEMFKTNAEGYFFSSTNNLLGSLSTMPLQLPKLEELTKDNYTTATLAFEEGKIVAKSTTYTNPFLGSILSKFSGPTVNLSLLEKYPSNNINAIIMASFNPAIFGGVLQQLEVEGIVNEFLKQSGISSSDLYGAMKGDIAVIVSDLGIGAADPMKRKDELFLSKEQPMGKMIVNIPVGNKDNFNKIMNKAIEMGTVQKNGKEYKGADLLRTMGLYLIANEQQLIIASDSVTYTQYITSTTKSLINKEALNYFKGKSTILYIDVANTINGFAKDSTDGFHNSMITAKNTVKDIMGSSENFSGGSIKAVFEVRMQNEEQNSLVTLMSLFTNIAVDARVQAKREKEMDQKLFPTGVPGVIRAN
jgi:hypothetical protein